MGLQLYRIGSSCMELLHMVGWSLFGKMNGSLYIGILCGPGLYLRSEPLFMIWTIVCVALSKDVHLFIIREGREMRRVV